MGGLAGRTARSGTGQRSESDMGAISPDFIKRLVHRIVITIVSNMFLSMDEA